MQTQVRRISVNDTELAYVELGGGDSLVFVHGGFSDYRSWESQVQFFSQKYRAISYSMRYHYPNKRGTDGTDYTIPVHTKDIVALIELLGASPAHIIGSSYGGRIALHLARDRPDLVRTLVLAEPGLGAWLQQRDDGPPVLADLMNNYFDPGTKAIDAGDLELGTRLFVTGVSGPGWFERLPREVLSRYKQNIRVQAFHGSPAPFTREEAEKISAPVLLLTGESTKGLFRIVVEELMKHLPRAERAEIPNSSHLMTVFNGDEFNRTVLSFVSRHS